FEWILELNRWVRLPDIIFYLDLSPEVALKRVADRSIYHSSNFLEIVRENYMKLIKEEPWKSRTFVINANRNEETVFNEILNIFLTRLKGENEVRSCR
ncbi:MAG: hypothetical protein NZ992_01625, partial [Candidatus Korarchaeum sp.]|nr:hypothetical protein [Candidatus Korarchaeum sp.]MDW8035494.1 hypothetical protein [Candidatus Korarchaeum sp.]